MLVIPVILSAIFLSAECLHVNELFRAKRQESPVWQEPEEERCDQRLRQCFRLVSGYGTYFQNIGSHLTEMVTEEFVDGLCSDLRNMIDCTRTAAQTSDCASVDVEERTYTFTSLLELACDDTTKSLVRAAQHSPCASDDRLGTHAFNRMRFCFGDNQSNSQEDRCRALAGVTTCLQNSASRLCGEAFGDLVVHYWEHTRDLMTAGNCP